MIYNFVVLVMVIEVDCEDVLFLLFDLNGDWVIIMCEMFYEMIVVFMFDMLVIINLLGVLYVFKILFGVFVKWC